MRRETPNPAAEVGYRRIEAGGIAGRDRVRDRPVHRGLAAALWRRASTIPAASAGTHPGPAIDPGAIAAARRHRLPLPRLRPRHISDVQGEGDLVVTVCDLAREELGGQAAVHWSVPDPVPAGDPASFDTAVADLSGRVGRLAPLLAATS